jgi:hypothetical protein
VQRLRPKVKQMKNQPYLMCQAELGHVLGNEELSDMCFGDALSAVVRYSKKKQR